MLEKVSTEEQRYGVVGRVCVELEPPRSPPTQPRIPRPPRPDRPPPPPTEAVILSQYTYRDGDGDCWWVIEWGGVGNDFAKVTKTPITC